ncbi:MAG: ABC transporter permease [Actinobacteria bacterium]|nr:ABC transporter permease [Actinomycetota bacterium]
MPGLITPPAGLIPLGGRPRLRDYLRMAWNRREFAFNLAHGQFRAQHMDTVLGNVWQLINPVLLIAIYYLIFGVLLSGARGDLGGGDNYVGFLGIGVFIYSYQQRVISAGASAIVGNLGLIRSLQFPRAVLPTATVIKEVLGFASSLVVMVALMAVSGEGIHLDMLWFPVAFFLITAFAMGGALVTARMTEAVRDVRNVLPFVFRLGFYLSGVLYDPHRFIDGTRFETYDWALLFNPFYVYISLARESMMSTFEPRQLPWIWAAAVVWAVVALVFGLWYFLGAEKRYGRG